MNILFRADSSSIIGTGHIMRDLVLAKQYKDSNVVFATQELSGNINYKIIESNFKIELLKSNSIDELNSLIKKLKIDMVVIDHYMINYSKEKQIKTANPDIKILSFDDTYEKHYCDILLNHNLGADAKKYKGLVPKDCELRCGSKYTLLRNEFIKEKKKIKNKKLRKKPLISNIFVAIGGSDTYNLNPKILNILKQFSNIKVNIVTTSANNNLKDLKHYCRNKKWIELYVNSNKLAKLMRKSDLAIITPSVIANEVFYMRIPMIAIKVEENQNDIYKYLKKNKFSTLKKFNKRKLTNLLLGKGLK